jgi:hypothetical protein
MINTPCTDAKQWCNGGGAGSRPYNGNGTLESRDQMNDLHSEHQIMRSAAGYGHGGDATHGFESNAVSHKIQAAHASNPYMI